MPPKKPGVRLHLTVAITRPTARKGNIMSKPSHIAYVVNKKKDAKPDDKGFGRSVGAVFAHGRLSEDIEPGSGEQVVYVSVFQR